MYQPFALKLLFACTLYALCVLNGLRTPAVSHAAESTRTKRVLLISTGSRFAPGFVVAEQTLLDRLRSLSPGQLEFYSESLDIVRFPSESYRRLFRNYLYEKYAESPPDLLILIYVGNLAVAGQLLEQLFPDVKTVVVGFTEEQVPTGWGKQVGGLAQRADPRGTIGLIRRLQPEIGRVIVIGGTAEVDRQLIRSTEAVTQTFGDLFKFDFWTNQSMSEIRAAVKSLPPQTAILFTRMFRDAVGQAFSSTQAARLIAEVANAPVYVMTDTMLGSGAIGGSVADVASMAMQAADLAHRTLNDVEPPSLSVETRSEGVPMFDWRALNRWGISESRLPAGSVVRFRPISVWEQYRWYLVGTLIIVALQAAIITDLLLHRRRRRRAESELRESREFMEMATEAGRIGLWVRDMARDDLWANARLRSMFGFAQDERFGIKQLEDRIYPADRSSIQVAVEHAQRSKGSFEVEFRSADSVVPKRWMVARGRMVRDAHGEALRAMGTVVDITERKLAEERLSASEQNFRTLVESTAAVPWEADVESWNFTYVGPQALSLLGYPVEQWHEKDFWLEHLHPDDKDFAVKTYMALSTTAEQCEFDYRLIADSGKIVWVHDIVHCDHRDGTPAQLRGFLIDITERKQTEQALSESEARFRVMADTAPVMIWMSGPDKLYSFFNKGWLDFTGRKIEQELADGWAEGVHCEDLQRCLDTYVQSFEARQAFTMEYRLRRHDGEYYWILDHGVPRFEHDGTFLGFIGIALDITERRQTEELLEQERAFLRQVIDINPNFIFAKDREGRFTLANQAVAEAYGTTAERLIGKTDADFNSNTNEVESFRRMDREVIDTLTERFIPEERITDARGGVRLLQTVKRPIIEKDGRARQVLGAATDITRRKQAEVELRQQRDELAHVTRVSTMGELAASLAHELNQPLTAILSNAQAAQRFLIASPTDLGEVHEILKDIIQDNNRASNVIRQMRALVKKEEHTFSPLDLAGVINDVVTLVHSDAILQGVRVLLDHEPGLSPVRGDKVQLQQVFLNLMLNGFQAMKNLPVTERELNLRTGRAGGRMLTVAVRDRGTGVGTDKLEKIFQPFYTTKRDGLGMGLSICRSIVEGHGGRLWARNNPDAGATFYFTLPIAQTVEEKVDQ